MTPPDDLATLVKTLRYIKTVFPHAAWSFAKTPHAIMDSMASVEFYVHRQDFNKWGGTVFSAWQGQVAVSNGLAVALVQKHVPDTGWVMHTYHEIPFAKDSHIIPWLSKARETIGQDPHYDIDSMSGLPGYYHMPTAYKWFHLALSKQAFGNIIPRAQGPLNHLKVRLRNYPDPVYVNLLQGGILPEHTCLGRLTDGNGNTPKHADRLRDAVEDYFAEALHSLT